MTLSQNHLEQVCMLGCGSRTCRYLYNDELDSSKWYCNKLRPIEKAKADDQVDKFLIDCKKRKLNYRSLNKAVSDNCEGYLLLKNINQGFDC